MANLPPLNYFMEKEAADVAIKHFNLILQEALKEYKNVWARYLNFVNQYQEDNSRSLSEEKTRIERQKDENNKSSRSIYLEEPHTTNSASSIENTLQECTLDFHSNIESLNDKNTFEDVSPIPESPIFYKNNSNFRNINSNRNIFMDNSSEDTCTINNLRNDNKWEISDKTNSTVTKDSTSNVPSIFLCSTSTKGTKWNKTKNGKKNSQSKTVTPLNNLRIRNNLRTIKKEKAMKTPLQVINNVNLTPKNNSLIDKSNNTKLNTIPYDIQVTLAPNNKKFKQTKLVFHKIKKTMELSNNLKSTDTPTLTKTDITGTEKKETNNEHDDNTCNQTEKVENAIENIQIKNELIYHQEYEINDSMEANDSLNNSNESTSTFFSEYENNINLDQTIDSCNIDRTSSPLARLETESKYKNQNMKKRQTKILKTKENVIRIIDLDEPEEKRIELSKNRSCSECKQYGKKQCWHYRDIPYKRETTPIDVVCISISPDSPSSTT
ncbi:hypothetical protein HZH66_003786 [Vespula vulgaris]|uniref:Uncharacterized protein n=1 Tax=Vespula vulgaris TaxID=7454 RepID=A0A834NCE0_VESVU|nr:hypothetical protein HZH66_003786 [Vespula vulgaris]